jgi:uncharacterized protein (TIGR02145 family)
LAADFATLMTYLDPAGIFNNNTAGGQMKEIGLTYWNTPNTDADNTSKFNGRGSGIRNNLTGVFSLIKEYGNFWNGDAAILTNARYSSLRFDLGVLSTSHGGTDILADVKYGHSIRLLKDSTTLTHGQTGTYTGNDGKIYRTICIGTQEWLSENLAETQYRDGSEISHGGADPDFYTNAEWAALTTEACCVYNNEADVMDGFYCWYNNDITNKSIYGALYNFYAVDHVSDIAYLERDGVEESGWRVPTKEDYEALSAYLGGDTVSGGKLKESGFDHWKLPNIGATDAYDFKGLPSGDRSHDTGSFAFLTYCNFTWASTEYDSDYSYYSSLLYNEATFYLVNNGYKALGFAVRLVKDI